SVTRPVITPPRGSRISTPAADSQAIRALRSGCPVSSATTRPYTASPPGAGACPCKAVAAKSNAHVNAAARRITSPPGHGDRHGHLTGVAQQDPRRARHERFQEVRIAEFPTRVDTAAIDRS